MVNPLLKGRKSWFYFLFIAFLLSALQVFILYYFYNIQLTNAVLDSLVFNLPFCGLALNSWYIVKYIDVDTFKPVSIIINHLVAALVAVALWLFAGVMIFKLLKNHFGDHLTFVYDTLPGRFLLGFLLYLGVILLFYSFNYYSNLREKSNREVQLQALVKEAELNVPKSQINPHFIFNSLNSISSLTIIRPAEARDMIIKLSEFLRYALDQDTKQKTFLKDELENIKRYLQIEKIRFGSRLEFTLKISSEAEKKLLPNMILQPLIENAVKHGVQESTEPIHIEIEGTEEKGNLKIAIKNNFDKDLSPKKGSGIGLKNIRERLNLIYNRTDLFLIENSDNIFKVYIIFPQ